MQFVQLAILFFCLMGSAFFSGMETGIISLNHLRLRHLVRNGNRNARILSRFLAEPDRLLGTILVGTNLLNITCSVVMASLFVGWMGPRGSWAAGVTTTLLLLVFGEYLPKGWMSARPAKRALPLAGLLALSGKVVGPVERAATLVASVFFPIPENIGGSFYKPITREDLLHLTHSGHSAGELTEIENHMINSVMALKDKRCIDIMVPRRKVAYCNIDTPADEILRLAQPLGFNRFPVCNTDNGDFVGMVYIFDILKDHDRGSKTARSYMQSPQYIDSDTSVYRVLPRMRLTRQPFLMVTDRQTSKVIGIIALNEILKWIV